jgi:hypothetical protein
VKTKMGEFLMENGERERQRERERVNKLLNNEAPIKYI